jgi:hypothetical protein
LLGEEEEKEDWKEKQLGAFFPGSEAGHALLAVPSWIFVAVKCS